MDIFETIVNEDTVHAKYKLLRDKSQLSNERSILQNWVDGMKDKDNKIIKEFQTTFHSSFWEFCLYALFKRNGFELNQDHQIPDFIVKAPVEFYIEAVVAQIKQYGRPESDRNIEDILSMLIPPHMQKDFFYLLDEAIVRMSNAFLVKSQKYIEYIKKPWINSKKSYVIALSSYDQINYGREYIYPVIALLYGMYYDPINDVYIRKKKITKPCTDSEIDIGLFLDERYKHISAVIYTCTLTLGKLTALSISQKKFSLNRVVDFRLNVEENKYQLQIVNENSPEYLADGIFVFHNPNAEHPLPVETFESCEISQFFYDENKLKILGNCTPLVARLNAPSFLINREYIQEMLREYNRHSPREFYDSV